MQVSRAGWWKRISAIVVLCLLAACSTLRLGYDQGPQLVWWWLDGYADFDASQASPVKDAIHRWFAWHRKTQLPGYAEWLATVRPQVGESVTPAQVCRWSDDGRRLVGPAIDQALVRAAPLVPLLTDAQFRHIERRYEKSNEEFREEYLQPDAGERLDAAVKRTVERAELFYGRIDEAQRKLIVATLQASPLDRPAWLAERQRRQRDILATLRKLAAERLDEVQTVAALRALSERTQSGPPPWRAYQQRLADYNCAFVARLHATTTAEQRRAARERIEGWENDLRLLAAAAP